MIYAGAQKNMGIAGLGVAIIKEDLLQKVAATTPVLLDYKLMIENDSMYNTPPAYAIYVLGLVLEWIDSMGGLEVMQERIFFMIILIVVISISHIVIKIIVL